MSQILVALAVTFGAPALKDKPSPEHALIGEWRPESHTVGGTPLKSRVDRWVFRADGAWAAHGGGMEVGSGSFTLDPKRSPSTLDLARGPDGGPPSLCRYRIDEDTLVLSIGVDQGVRPADVEPSKNTVVWVLKRAKKKD